MFYDKAKQISKEKQHQIKCWYKFVVFDTRKHCSTENGKIIWSETCHNSVQIESTMCITKASSEILHQCPQIDFLSTIFSFPRRDFPMPPAALKWVVMLFFSDINISSIEYLNNYLTVSLSEKCCIDITALKMCLSLQRDRASISHSFS